MADNKGPFGSLIEITKRPPIVFTEGHGSWLKDQDGKEYLDFIQGWAVNAFGHCPDFLVAAISRQAKKLINCSPAFYNEMMIRLADVVVRHTGMGRVFFTNSGAEANEGAVKLARKWGQKFRGGAYEIITFDHAFHGRTLAMMSASGKVEWEKLYEPKVPGFPKLQLNDLAAVRAAITDKTVGLMLEPIQGEAGVLVATDDFLKGLYRIAREKNILLILDEIQTGMGRTGKLFAYEYCGFVPDILTLAKGLGGGVPLGALVAKEEVCVFDPGDQGGTFNGNPLMMAAGIAIFEAMTKPGFLESVQKTGMYLRQKLEEVSRQFGHGEVRGRGLLLALDLSKEIGTQIVEESLKRGLLLNSPRKNTLRFMPALNVSRDEVDKMIAILREAIQAAG
ncbi:MAG TPA: acetylornithine transaminase [Thermodesulfobacteriota bacterium]|nr:acetylornithine transaminase [Thermodesulfobacteriota bacterium]